MPNWNKIALAIKQVHDSQNKVKKTFTVEASEDDMKIFETMLNYISWLCGVGHSTSFEVYVDGDGAANIKIKDAEDYSDELNLKKDVDGDIKSFNFGV